MNSTVPKTRVTDPSFSTTRSGALAPRRGALRKFEKNNRSKLPPCTRSHPSNGFLLVFYIHPSKERPKWAISRHEGRKDALGPLFTHPNPKSPSFWATIAQKCYKLEMMYPPCFSPLLVRSDDTRSTSAIGLPHFNAFFQAYTPSKLSSSL